MGDLSKNFSKLEIVCPCSCGADKISPVLIEKLQKVRNIIGRPIIITSGVRCEFYNASLKASMKKDEDVSIFRATDWEPMEITLVSIPADSSVGVGRSDEPS